MFLGRLLCHLMLGKHKPEYIAPVINLHTPKGVQFNVRVTVRCERCGTVL